MTYPDKEYKYMLEKLPSLYDYFYYDKWIIDKLCKVDNLKNFLENYGCTLNGICHGYLYFTEIAIINLISHIESLVSDYSISEFIDWSSSSIENKNLMKLLEKAPEIEYLLKLLAIRKRFSSLRFQENCYEEEIRKTLHELGSILNDIDRYLTSKYKVSKRAVDSTSQNNVLLNWILNNYNYIESHTEFDSYEKERDIPLWPGSVFFNLMPKNMLKSAYLLQNPKIKNKEKEYIYGFSLVLFYLYNFLIPNCIDKYSENLLHSQKWKDIHKIGTKIFQECVKKSDIFTKLFDMDLHRELDGLKKGKIRNYNELRVVLRDRDVRVIENRFNGDYPNNEALFMHLFFGTIYMYRIGDIDKPEIIEFKQIGDEENWVEYSYAMYIPVGGPFWNSSHWIIFDNLCTESDLDPVDSFRIKIYEDLKRYEEKEMIIFRKYEVSKDLLQKYIKSKDYDYLLKRHTLNKLNTCKGLFSEFLAGYYFFKKEENLKNVKSIDIHREIENTDIDVIIEKEDTIIIIQVKSSFDFDNYEDVIEHFRKVMKNLKTTKKKVEKVLFVMQDELPPHAEKMGGYHTEFKNGEEIIVVESYDIKRECLDAFNEENIRILLLKDIERLLKRNDVYKDFLTKIKEIYSKSDECDLLNMWC